MRDGVGEERERPVSASGRVPWKALADGVTLRVRLTPNGGRDSIDGIAERADGTMVLLARVRAVPEKGAANAALEALLGKRIGVAKSRVRVVGGESVRLKTVRIDADPETTIPRLEAMVT